MSVSKKPKTLLEVKSGSILEPIGFAQYQFKGITAKEIRGVFERISDLKLDEYQAMQEILMLPVLRAYPCLQLAFDKEITLEEFDSKYNIDGTVTQLVYAVGLLILTNNKEDKKSKEVGIKIEQLLQKIINFDDQLYAQCKQKALEKANEIEPIADKIQKLEIQVIKMICDYLKIDVNELDTDEMEILLVKTEQNNEWHIDFFTSRATQKAEIVKKMKDNLKNTLK